MFPLPSSTVSSRSPRLSRAVLLTTVALTLSACNTLDRLSEVGEPPKTSRIADPTQTANYQPVSMPMPSPQTPTAGANSLWRPGARGFFKDTRATEVGDILTVAVSINESGTLKNQTQTSTASSDTANPSFGLLGLESSVGKVFSGASTSSLWNFGSSGGINGNGSIGRSEAVTVNLAATIVQKLPNGNLVISGKQELRVNSEMREVSIQGIIRPEDISSANTIASSKIAEARITYGGRGTLSDIQQPRYGQQIFDIIAPF
ncbi:MAG TPA: flagellar basal body L-ring protein FlgH [Candidatus Sulfotelmatobacter sp.]|jgi:flagellar L-ring protein precursor FlgH|nr:flagellar basal body L-ring protein FlgH [Candidatus Sulfotelmatobacter sp.]